MHSGDCASPSSEPSDEQTQYSGGYDERSLVVDIGSGSTKARRGNSSVVSLHCDRSACYSPKSPNYIGDEAEQFRELLTLTQPINDGVVTDWDDYELLFTGICERLRVDVADFGVLLVESPLNKHANRERMTQIMFETFNVRRMYVEVSGVLSLYSSGRVTGCVIESGDGTTHVTPVYCGYSLPHAVMKMPVAGRHITDYLHQMLRYEHNYTPKTAAQRMHTRLMKEQFAYVSLNYENDMRNSAKNLSKYAKTYCHNDLPYANGEMTLASERFRCTEPLFQPALLGHECSGLHDMVHACIQKCDMDIRRSLYANCVLSGGTTLLPQFGERVRAGLELLAPKAVKVRVDALPNREWAAWAGGSVLAGLSHFEELWIERDDYDDVGPRIVHSKCF